MICVAEEWDKQDRGIFASEIENISIVVGSVVSVFAFVILCAWCRNYFGYEEGETYSDDEFLPPKYHYSPIDNKGPPSISTSDSLSPNPSPPSTPLHTPRSTPGTSPGMLRKSLYMPQPPDASFMLKSPQSDLEEIVIPPEPAPPDPNARPNLGQIHFSLNYDSNDQTLNIRIIKATALPAKDFSGTSDPFVKVMLLPDKKHKLETRVKRRNLHPFWNETFAFEGYPYTKIMNRTLYLQVLDYDRFSRNDAIGEVELDLSTIELGYQTLTFCRDLKPCKSSQSYLGDILLSLCYQPTASRINIIVMKCSNLKKMDVSGSTDPYVKVYLMHNGKRVEKKKTTIKKRNLNPVWNESFMFDVPIDKLREVTFVFTVMDYDRITQNEVIGQVILGYRTSGASLRQWTEMMNHPRKPIAYWHRLNQY